MKKSMVDTPKKKKKSLVPKNARKTLVKKLDKLWSEIVCKNWNGKCAICGKVGNQAHHFFSRRNYSTRWSTTNGLWMCFSCHIRKVHQQGMTEDARDALINKIGQGRFDLLKERSKMTVKYTLDDLRTLGEFLK